MRYPWLIFHFCRSSMGAQEEAFASLDGEELLEKGVASSQQAIARSNALGGLLASNSTPDDGPASPLPPYSPSQDIKGKSKESSGFLAILSDSFRTVATNLVRAKPEPMVIAMCEVAKDGDIRHLKGFISQGVNINGQNEDGHTPLICAVRANQLDAINYLASAGADIAAKDSHSGQKKPPLFHAAECGHLSATETLINLGANIHETSWLGQPFFVEVGSSSPLPMLKLFLTHGANPNTTSNTGRSIMVDALRSGSLDRLRLLHEHGGDTNTPDITGQPPLHMALGQNRLDIIDFLLAHGADPNSVSITGKSILHSALQQKLYPLVKTLLIRGANPNVSDLMGTTFLAALVNLTPNPIPTPNSTTADEIVPDLIRLALTKGADPNQTDSWGTPLLSHVLEKGSTPLLRTFLEHRANPNTPFRDQGTLLLYALEQGRDDQALLLLKHGADPNGRDGKGRTPLMEALQGGRMDVVTALVAAGADVNLGGVVRPVVFARAMGAREVVRLLEAKGAEDVRGVAGGRLAGASVGGLGVPGAGQVGEEEEEEEEVPPAYSEANTL